jgi:hypothetical protein
MIRDSQYSAIRNGSGGNFAASRAASFAASRAASFAAPSMGEVVARTGRRR